MGWFVTSLRENPELAVFLTLAVGFAIGRVRIGSFRLGNVVGTLLGWSADRRESEIAAARTARDESLTHRSCSAQPAFRALQRPYLPAAVCGPNRR